MVPGEACFPLLVSQLSTSESNDESVEGTITGGAGRNFSFDHVIRGLLGISPDALNV